MKLMFTQRNKTNGNPFENDLEDEIPSSCPSAATGLRTAPFIRIPIVIFCTVIVFILLIVGTATTAISFPPKPPTWKVNEEGNPIEIQTALDGDYKLIGPLLITAGGFLLIVDIILCAIVTKDAYIASRTIRPSVTEPMNHPGGVSPLGGPFYLATPNPTVSNPNAMVPFAFSRHLWTIPNAPTPDFSLDDEILKGSKVRAATATLVRGSQPPYNPDMKTSEEIS